MRKLRFGVLGAAKIAREKVIPPHAAGGALRGGGAGLARRRPRARQAAGAARHPDRATAATRRCWPTPAVDAVYNPLPNHLHVPWTVKAAEAGKHVLCEKPIGLDAAEAEKLIEVRDRTGVRIQEAFMVRTHPQWLRARELVRSRAGSASCKAIHGHFSYHLTDPTNVRNVAGMGRRRAARHRLLPDHHLALRHRAGAAPGRGRDRARPGDAASTGWARRCSTTGGVQCASVRHPARAAADDAVPRHQGPARGRGRRSTRRTTRPAGSPSTTPGRASAAAVAETIEMPTCDQYGIMGDAFAAASRTARRSRCRSRTASPTCG